MTQNIRPKLFLNKIEAHKDDSEWIPTYRINKYFKLSRLNPKILIDY